MFKIKFNKNDNQRLIIFTFRFLYRMNLDFLNKKKIKKIILKYNFANPNYVVY